MCNFVPRECLAFGNLAKMKEAIIGWIIPGSIETVSLLPENEDYQNREPFDGYGFLHVTNIPEGLEILVVSKLSAALAQLISRNEAVAELNAYIPFGADESFGQEAFSPVAQQIINRLSDQLYYRRDKIEFNPIAVLDTGIDPSSMRLHDHQPAKGPHPHLAARQLNAIDYMNENNPKKVNPRQIADTLGHGSVVCRILDSLLPPEVPIVVGRVAKRKSDVTVLYLARCFAHIVAAKSPRVVNLSLAPFRDHIDCPHCNGLVPVDGFHTLTLPRIFELAAGTTWTVMAAGNRGRNCNADHYLADVERLVYATAIDSSGRPASYSNYIYGDKARSISAFGGDPKPMEGGHGILSKTRAVAGTSFAAPFVSATIWMECQLWPIDEDVLRNCSRRLANAHVYYPDYPC